MSEIEEALDRIDKYIESGSEEPPDPETQISIIALSGSSLIAKQLRKASCDTEIDEAELYRRAEEIVREHVKNDHDGHCKFNI